MARLTRSGVHIRKRKGVPLFSIDESDPSRFVRKLNGKVDVGVFEDGIFKVVVEQS